MKSLFENYCHDCHGGGTKRGGLDIQEISGADPSIHREVWEKVILRLDTR